MGLLENDGGALFKRWKHQPDPSIIILLPLTGVSGVPVKYSRMSSDMPWMPMWWGGLFLKSYKFYFYLKCSFFLWTLDFSFHEALFPHLTHIISR